MAPTNSQREILESQIEPEERKHSGKDLKTISLNEAAQKELKLVPGPAILRETLLAIDRSSLGRLEGYFTFFSTI
jgi:hypothetical protein